MVVGNAAEPLSLEIHYWASCYKDWIELWTNTASYELMLAKVRDTVSKCSAMSDSFLTYIMDGE